MKTAVVTGANGGIGYHTALQLARSGYKIILACRDQIRGADAMLRISKELPDAQTELVILDLSSLDSVRSASKRIAQNYESLDLLVNNAAVMALPKRVQSKDGYEMQFATNHLGHFAITAELFPLLQNAEAARVVTVSSIAHRYGKIEFDNLQGEKDYEGWKAYGASKLANLLFAFELARHCKAAGSAVKSVAAHPGVAKTNILASGPQMGPKALRTYVSEIFTHFFAQTDEQGALPVLHASLADDVQNGDYFGPDGFMEVSGKAHKVEAKAHARDEDTARKLWTESEKLTASKMPI